MRFLILAISYKHGGLCVAGLDYDSLRFVRIGKGYVTKPDCLPLSVIDMRVGERTLRVMDLIEIDVIKLPTVGPQCENYRLIKINRFVKTLSLREIDAVYNKIIRTESIFLNGNKIITASEATGLESSIGFFKVSDFRLGVTVNETGTPKYRSWFTYNNVRYSNLSTTDCAVCGYPPSLYGLAPLVGKDSPIKRLGDVYITVTLPPEPWTGDNCYYKYVSGIIFTNVANEYPGESTNSVSTSVLGQRERSTIDNGRMIEDINDDETLEDVLLSSEQRELYLEIIYKSKNDWLIPIRRAKRIIGFGSYEQFYMYWINNSEGEMLFNARMQYISNVANNKVSVPFKSENRTIILQYMENIYKSYCEIESRNASMQRMPTTDTQPQNVTETKSVEKNASAMDLSTCLSALEFLRNRVDNGMYEASEGASNVAKSSINYLEIFINKILLQAETHAGCLLAGSPWSAEEDSQLKREFYAGDKIKDIAAKHKRSVGAIRSRILKLGL